jgi:carbonic anhydrase/acetyltransferase-like protein (isoleucine patch superfamily)
MNEPRAGRVRLAPTAFVAPGAVVLGEVTIGPRASVWFNTVVRGDVDTIELGEASNLQDNSTVHVDAGQPVKIGARVTVGHRAIVHGCVIEDDCLIGMGSVLLSGCRIGAGSYVGASSLVLEDAQIPPGSVALGSPARVVGPVGERHREGIRHGSETYAELAAGCMRRGYARPVGREGEIVHPRQSMSYAEWDSRVALLNGLPDRFSVVLGGAGNGNYGRPLEARLIELVEALRGTDVAVRQPIAERLGRGEEARWEEAPDRAEPGRRSDLGEHVSAWREQRGKLTEALSTMGPDEWRRMVGHRTRGPFTLAELIREWTEEDLAAIDRVLREAREGEGRA